MKDKRNRYSYTYVRQSRHLSKTVKKSKEGQCMIMGSVHQKTFVNVYVPNIGTSQYIKDPVLGQIEARRRKG